MFETIQKHTPVISVSLLIFPLIFGIGMAIAFTARENWEQKESNELTKSEFTRNTFLDLLGIALTMSAAMWLGRLLGGYAGQAVGSKIGQAWGMIAGIAAGMVGGFAAAFVVGRVWGGINSAKKHANARRCWAPLAKNAYPKTVCALSISAWIWVSSSSTPLNFFSSRRCSTNASLSSLL